MHYKRSSIKFGECVYCGEIRPLTVDHIPPKNLFPKPRPDNLYTVPSCYPCNNESSKDDEYFRLNIVLREDTPEHVEGSKLFKAVMRSLTRIQSAGYKKSFLSGIKDLEVFTPHGLYLGEVSTYDVELTRVDKVAARMIKGLYYKERSKRLSDEYEVNTYSMTNLIAKQFHGIVQTLLQLPPNFVGKREVFSYWSMSTKDDPDSSVWLLLFFEATAFIGFITPRKNIFKG